MTSISDLVVVVAVSPLHCLRCRFTATFLPPLLIMTADVSTTDYIGECLLSLEELQDAQPHQLRRSLRRAPARDKAWQVCAFRHCVELLEELLVGGV